MSEYTITKKQILEIASLSNRNEKELKILFPKVFEEEETKYFGLDKLKSNSKHKSVLNQAFFTDSSSEEAGFFDNHFIQVRTAGLYKNKAFFLSKHYNWELVLDEREMNCLLPTKK